MSDPASPESSPDIPELFFDRLEDDHGDLIYLCSELYQQINERNLKGVFTALDALEGRIKGMRNISIIFDGYLDKHEQLTTSLNPNLKGE